MTGTEMENWLERTAQTLSCSSPMMRETEGFAWKTAQVQSSVTDMTCRGSLSMRTV